MTLKSPELTITNQRKEISWKMRRQVPSDYSYPKYIDVWYCMNPRLYPV